MKGTRKFKTSKELADFIGCTEGCITRWLNTGLPHKITGRSYEYDLSEVLHYLTGKSTRHKRWVLALQERLSDEGK
jgi:hypothetical protein